MIKQDDVIMLKISAKTKREFKEALETLNNTISGSIREHIFKQIQKAERIRKNPRLITD